MSFSFLMIVAPQIPNVNTDDNSAAASTCYLYRVHAVDTANCSSPNSIDLATTIIFADPNLAGTLIRGIHLAQLRQAVDAVRTTAGIGAFTWTDPPAQAEQGALVKASQIIQVRDRLNDALPILGFPQMPPDSSIASGLPIYAVHLQNIRDRVK